MVTIKISDGIEVRIPRTNTVKGLVIVDLFQDRSISILEKEYEALINAIRQAQGIAEEK